MQAAKIRSPLWQTWSFCNSSYCQASCRYISTSQTMDTWILSLGAMHQLCCTPHCSSLQASFLVWPEDSLINNNTAVLPQQVASTVHWIRRIQLHCCLRNSHSRWLSATAYSVLDL